MRSRACCTLASVTAAVVEVEALVMRRSSLRLDTPIATTFLTGLVAWDF
jgi:hypothetical protein